MDRRILTESLRLSDQHVPYVLVQVVDTQGSVPGKRGAALVYREDGSTTGTVGGAQLEERAKLLAREALRRRAGGLHHFELRAWEAGGLPSLCGGSVDLAVTYVEPRPNLLLWGGGHVAQAIARQARLLDYDVSVADDRPEYLDPALFPDARRRILSSAQELPSRITASGERFSHVYLLGYDAVKDQEVALGLLPTFPGKVGLVASRTKAELTRRALKERGLSDELLSRLRTPIGLPLGGVTPEEIALSVVAEIVQERHAQDPTSERKDEGAP